MSLVEPMTSRKQTDAHLREREVTYFGVKPGTADNTDSLNVALGALNNEEYDVLNIPPGEIYREGPISDITRLRWAIKGAGQGLTKLYIPSTAGAGVGTFFGLGTADAGAGSGMLSGMSLVCQNTAVTAADYGLKTIRGNEINVRDVTMSGVGSGLQIGREDAEQTLNDLSIDGFSLELRSGKGGTAMKIWQAGGLKVKDFAATCDGNPDPDLKGIHYKLIGRGDTARFTNCHVNFADANAKQNLILDAHTSLLGIANLWFIACVFDHAVEAGVDVYCDLATGVIRRVWFIGCRVFSEQGHAIRYSPSIIGEAVDIHYIGCELSGGSSASFPSVVKFPPSTAKRSHILGGTILDNGNNQKNGVELGIEECTITGVYFGPRLDISANDMDHAVKITADLSSFAITGNLAKDLQVDFIEHFAYTAGSHDRVCENNTGVTSNPSPRVLHTGGVAATQSTDGLNTVPAVTETYIAEVLVPYPVTITGIAVMHGTVVAGNIKLGLANKNGVVVAQTASTAAAGAADSYQKVPLTTPYKAQAGTYYVLLQCDNTAHRFNVHLLGTFGASRKLGETYGTFTTITPPTTFTTNGPIASLY